MYSFRFCLFIIISREFSFLVSSLFFADHWKTCSPLMLRVWYLINKVTWGTMPGTLQTLPHKIIYPVKKKSRIIKMAFSRFIAFIIFSTIICFKYMILCSLMTAVKRKRLCFPQHSQFWSPNVYDFFFPTLSNSLILVECLPI